jgi:hypothetical protein
MTTDRSRVAQRRRSFGAHGLAAYHATCLPQTAAPRQYLLPGTLTDLREFFEDQVACKRLPTHTANLLR